MKTFQEILFPCLFLLISGQTQINFENYNPRQLVDKAPGYGKTWMYFPDGNGIPQVVQLDIPDVGPRFKPPIENVVKFYLYTRSNPEESQIIELTNSSTVLNSNINFNKPIKFIIHGWFSSYESDTSQKIKNNFLEVIDCNVLLVDWKEIASNIIYPLSAKETTNVGDYIGKMVDFLVENGANLNDMHLVGHSLGAHIAGRAGFAAKLGKVGRVTGLDPALPGFEGIASEENRLDESDGKFVDVIHTCGGILGYYSKLGHVDFYPNGGVPSQPGCFGLPQLIEGCSHARSWVYFAESILMKNGFQGTLCTSWSDYKKGNCVNNTEVPMGMSTPSTARGVFYLKTNEQAPFRSINLNTVTETGRKAFKLIPFIPIIG